MLNGLSQLFINIFTQFFYLVNFLFLSEIISIFTRTPESHQNPKLSIFTQLANDIVLSPTS